MLLDLCFIARTAYCTVKQSLCVWCHRVHRQSCCHCNRLSGM